MRTVARQSVAWRRASFPRERYANGASPAQVLNRNLDKTKACKTENVRRRSRPLRQLPFANSRRRANSGEIPPCFKGVWLDRPNLRDWQGGDFRSLNGFRLFPSEPRGIWFGQRKRNVPSRLPIRVDQTFHRSSAARHSIRDTLSGRGAVRRCARLRMRQPEWPDRKGLQNRLLSIPGENSAATASRIAR